MHEVDIYIHAYNSSLYAYLAYYLLTHRKKSRYQHAISCPCSEKSNQLTPFTPVGLSTYTPVRLYTCLILPI